MAQDTLFGFPAHTFPYRRGEFTTLSTVSNGPETPGRLRMGWPPAYLRSFFWFFCSLGSF